MTQTGPEKPRGRTVPAGFLPVREFFTDAAGPELRGRIIADMRALATFLEEHPQLPVSPRTSVDVSYFPRTETDQAALAEVVEAGANSGRIPAWEGDHYLVEHHHGAGRYRVARGDSDAPAAWSRAFHATSDVVRSRH